MTENWQRYFYVAFWINLKFSNKTPNSSLGYVSGQNQLSSNNSPSLLSFLLQLTQDRKKRVCVEVQQRLEPLPYKESGKLLGYRGKRGLQKHSGSQMCSLESSQKRNKCRIQSLQGHYVQHCRQTQGTFLSNGFYAFCSISFHFLSVL